MVKCSLCGKEIEKIPTWMQDIDVPYICTNCPNYNLRNIATIDFMTEILKKPPETAKAVEEAEPEQDHEDAEE